MALTIYSDLHWGQTSEILVDTKPSKGDFFTGDIFDIKNTSKKIIKQQLQKQQDFNKDCKAVGAFVLLGNHDLLPDDKMVVHYYDKDGMPLLTNDMSAVPRHIVVDDVLLTHGHYCCWDQVQIDQWKEKKPKGVGMFRKLTLSIEELYNRGTWVPSQASLDRCYVLASGLNCKTIVFGHTHTETTVDTMYKGIRIINVGRGKTVLDI